jgi:serine phosphatase RsbU (regulator of sigma subunit)
MTGGAEDSVTLPDRETVPDRCPKCGRAYDGTFVVDARHNGGDLFRGFDHGRKTDRTSCYVTIRETAD